MSQGNQEQTLSQEPGDKFRTALQLRTITIQNVQKEITTQIEQLIPTKYCKSSEKVCAARPPDIMVLLVRGDHAAGGDQLERKVLNVPWDHLGNLENQE